MTGVGIPAIVHVAPAPVQPGESNGNPSSFPTRRGFALVACAAAVIGLEALAYLLHDPFEWTASRLWAIGGVGFVALGLVAIARAAAGALLGCSYTPALASSGLLSVTLLWLAAGSWRRAERGLALGWLAVAVITVGFAALSFLTRLDLFKEVDQTTIKTDLAEPLLEAFTIFLFGTPRLFLPPALYLPVMAALVLGLIGRLRLPGIAVAWWTLAVIVASTVLTGYSIRPPSFDLLRALVVIPPLLLLTGWTGLRSLRDRAAPRAPRAVLGVLTVFVVVQVVWSLAALERDYRPRLHEIVYADMVEQGRRLGIASDSRPFVVLLTDSSELDNAGDFLMYFYPGHRLLRSAEEASSIDPGSAPLFVYADADADAPGSLPWLEGRDGVLVEYNHPEFPRRLTRWVWSAPAPGSPDASSPAAGSFGSS